MRTTVGCRATGWEDTLHPSPFLSQLRSVAGAVPMDGKYTCRADTAWAVGEETCGTNVDTRWNTCSGGQHARAEWFAAVQLTHLVS